MEDDTPPANLEFVGQIPVTPGGMALRTVIGLITGDALDDPADVFAPEFLTRFPREQIDSVLREMRAKYAGGATLLRVEPGFTMTRAVGVVRGTETGEVFQVHVRAERESGRIASLYFQPAWEDQLDAKAWGQLDEEMGKLAGVAAIAAYEVRPEGGLGFIHTREGDRALALGPAHTLFVLGTLGEQMQRAIDHHPGTSPWEEAIPVQDRLKSLPPGDLRDVPETTPVSLAELAHRMSALGDNTAANHLTDFLGKLMVERYFMGLNTADPARTLPWLGTLEYFKLKLAEDATLADRYARSDTEARWNMLLEGGEVFKAIPNQGRFISWDGPLALGTVGHFASAIDVARLLEDLARKSDRPGMTPLARALDGPGLSIDRRHWASVGFKGGAEPGILSLNWILTRDDGRRFVLAFLWNDAEDLLPEGLGYRVAGAAVRLLATHGRAAQEP
ncbi:MAG: serine hydrolase [Phycisphaerae bacterium]|nr:serine hydrolase [Phycisphaerae bacterium]